MSNFNYILKRSKRKIISIFVKNDGSVVVCAPNKMPLTEIEKFVSAKRKWVEGHIAKFASSRNAFVDVINYQTVLVCGKPAKLTVGTNTNFVSEDGICVTSIKNLKELFILNFGDRFLNQFNELSAGFGLNFKTVTFKSYKSRWGCCDKDKNIVINYKLLMLPEVLWRLVAAHELCHTRYMNHSADFYKLLSLVLPECKQLKKQLKTYSFLCSMY